MGSSGNLAPPAPLPLRDSLVDNAKAEAQAEVDALVEQTRALAAVQAQEVATAREEAKNAKAAFALKRRESMEAAEAAGAAAAAAVKAEEDAAAAEATAAAEQMAAEAAKAAAAALVAEEAARARRRRRMRQRRLY